MNKTTSNEELSPDHTKANVQRVSVYHTASARLPWSNLLNTKNGHTYHKYRKSVFKTCLLFLSYKSSTLFVCVFFFFLFWKWECLTFPLEIGFSRKAILKNPQKTKAVHIVSLEYFLPIFFKLTKQNKTKSFSGTKGKKKNIKQWFWKQNEVWPIDLRIKRHYISSFLLASHWYLNAKIARNLKL